ncbi:MAG: M23 family metallopeptidase [Nocardioidaceae bacterium]|nr:M23 family metallopeptidase [Nocardioidaceae bacterium]
MSHRRVAALLVLVAAAAAASLGMGAAGAADERWVWPLSPAPALEAAFDPPESDFGAGHRGVDLAGAASQEVQAIGAGVVTFAARLAGRGVVVVDHGRLRSTYEPVNAQVEVGETVAAGDPLGTLTTTSSHCWPETCLHLGVRRGTTYLDPLTLLGPRPVRLKPLDAGDAGRDSFAGVPGRPSASSSDATTSTPEEQWPRQAFGLTAAVTAAVLLGGSTTRPTRPRQARG